MYPDSNYNNPFIRTHILPGKYVMRSLTKLLSLKRRSRRELKSKLSVVLLWEIISTHNNSKVRSSTTVFLGTTSDGTERNGLSSSRYLTPGSCPTNSSVTSDTCLGTDTIGPCSPTLTGFPGTRTKGDWRKSTGWDYVDASWSGRRTKSRGSYRSRWTPPVPMKLC